MTVLRLCKIAVSASAGALILLVALNNVLDYRTNFEVVQHILSMDAIPPSALTWRAVTSPALHHLCYAFIIATEFFSAGLTLRGAWRLWETRAASAQAFNAAKTLAAAGLTIAFLLYFFGFMAIGGEWFQMWRAGIYNMQEPAFRFIGSVGLALIFLMLADGDASSEAG
jgi:predicted small integral membrane protein